MPCVWSQVSKKMSMKIPCNFQLRTADSYTTFQTGLWRRPDTLQWIEASELKTSERQSNTVRTLGQASPIYTRSWISCSDMNQETITVRTEGQHHPDAFQVSRKLSARVSVFLSWLSARVSDWDKICVVGKLRKNPTTKMSRRPIETSEQPTVWTERE